MDYFFKYQTVILRTLGAMMLLIGFIVHFWVTPKEVVSANDRAAANLARMEASVSGSGQIKQKKQTDNSKFLHELKKTQAKQAEYLTIIVMVLGGLSLGYSFIKRKEEE